jgi:hypothetical protein
MYVARLKLEPGVKIAGSSRQDAMAMVQHVAADGKKPTSTKHTGRIAAVMNPASQAMI